MESLQIIQKANFGSFEVEFHKGEDGEIYVTREQIGQALGYSEPRKALEKIHERHADRIDKFSTVVKLGTVEGDREVTRDVIVYSARGIYEICRWSRQPKADEFQDFVYNILESLRKGQTELKQTTEPVNQLTGLQQAGKILIDTALSLKGSLSHYDSLRMIAKGSEMVAGEPIIGDLRIPVMTMFTFPESPGEEEFIFRVPDNSWRGNGIFMGDNAHIDPKAKVQAYDLVLLDVEGTRGIWKIHFSSMGTAFTRPNEFVLDKDRKNKLIGRVTRVDRML